MSCWETRSAHSKFPKTPIDKRHTPTHHMVAIYDSAITREDSSGPLPLPPHSSISRLADVERIVSQLKRPTAKTSEATRPLVEQLFAASEFEEGCGAIIQYGGVPTLAELLGSDDDEVRSLVEGILVRVSSEPLCLRIVIDSLVSILNHPHGKTRRQLEQAASALADLAHQTIVRDYLTNDDAIGALTNNLSSSSALLREHVLSALATLCHHSPNFNSRVHRLGKVQPLLGECVQRSDTSRDEKGLALTILMELPGGATSNVRWQVAVAALMRCVTPKCSAFERCVPRE